ncbi:hypothetical protein [Kutzneria sp. 744]|uniref:hypothetical protein n=1 Tax=Kutzneria sp. (strain 744) TaxID=345341 RepID=UPI0009FF5AE3
MTTTALTGARLGSPTSTSAKSRSTAGRVPATVTVLGPPARPLMVICCPTATLFSPSRHPPTRALSGPNLVAAGWCTAWRYASSRAGSTPATPMRAPLTVMPLPAPLIGSSWLTSGCCAALSTSGPAGGARCR